MRKAKSKTVKTKTVAARNGSAPHISDGMRGWWRKRYIKQQEDIETQIRFLRGQLATIKKKIRP